MKTFVSIFLLFAVISTAKCLLSNRETSTQGISGSSRYLQYIRERQQLERIRTQFESICPGKADDIDEALLKLKECTDQISEENETACSAVKNHFLICSKPLVQALEKCLPEESKEVPNLVFQSVNSGIAYLCKTDGEHIFELANTCIFKSNYRSMRCERRIRTKLQQYKNKPPTKTDICELANSFKPCLHNHLQDSCGHQITRESFTGMFDALIAPCRTTADNQIVYNEVEILE